MAVAAPGWAFLVGIFVKFTLLNGSTRGSLVNQPTDWHGAHGSASNDNNDAVVGAGALCTAGMCGFPSWETKSNPSAWNPFSMGTCKGYVRPSWLQCIAVLQTCQAVGMWSVALVAQS